MRGSVGCADARLPASPPLAAVLGPQLACCCLDTDFRLAPKEPSSALCRTGRARLCALPHWAQVTGSVTCPVPAPGPRTPPSSPGQTTLTSRCCYGSVACATCRGHVCHQPGLPFLAAGSGSASHSADSQQSCPSPHSLDPVIAFAGQIRDTHFSVWLFSNVGLPGLL